jgi:hypothetical protein
MFKWIKCCVYSLLGRNPKKKKGGSYMFVKTVITPHSLDLAGEVYVEEEPLVVKDISEPVLAIVEAMKDSSNWEVNVVSTEGSVGYCSVTRRIYDVKTNNEFVLVTNRYWYTQATTTNHFRCEWATKDERELLAEASVALIEAVEKVQEDKKYQAQEEANKAERERLMGDYCK